MNPHRLPPPVLAALVLGLAGMPEDSRPVRPARVDPEDQALRDRYRAERMARKAEAAAKIAERQKNTPTAE